MLREAGSAADVDPLEVGTVRMARWSFESDPRVGHFRLILTDVTSRVALSASVKANVRKRKAPDGTKDEALLFGDGPKRNTSARRSRNGSLGPKKSKALGARKGTLAELR